MAKKKKATPKVSKKISFDKVKATLHEFGKRARAVLEEEGCSKCKKDKNKDKFIYTSTYIRGSRVYIEVVCVTCQSASKVLMTELSPDDV